MGRNRYRPFVCFFLPVTLSLAFQDDCLSVCLTGTDVNMVPTESGTPKKRGDL